MSHPSHDDIVVPSDDVVIRTIAGECLLIPVRGSIANMQQIFALNEVSELIWNRMNGQRTVSDLINEVSKAYAVSSEDATRDVRMFLEQLRSAGLAGTPGQSIADSPQ